MRSFDPDEPDVVLGDDAVGEVQVDDDVVAVDADAALALLDRITADLVGGGEHRPGQREMVAAVAAAVTRGRHLVVEAGTGVGKSLGYLVPLALSHRRVVVATATKNLQDQLATKDAPLVAAHVGGLKVAVLKGRTNYLCWLRAKDVGGDGQMRLDGTDEEVPAGMATQLRRIMDWARTSPSGDRDELTFEPDARAWRQVSISPHECLGRSRCPEASRCFAERAKDRANESAVVIVNTHLYAAHLAAGSTILPAHDIVVLDEAHESLDIFATVLGTSVGAGSFRGAAASASPFTRDRPELSRDLNELAERLQIALAEQYDRNETTGLGENVQVLLAEGARLVTQLAESLRAAGTDGDDGFRRQGVLGSLTHLTNDLARLQKVTSSELLWLVRRDRDVEIELSLIDVGPRLREELWSQVTGVLTSATIPTSLRHGVGLDDADEIRVPSPFDYATHSLLYVPAHLPDRKDDLAEAAIADELVDLITAAGGRTLALFTNRAVMRRVADVVRARLDTPVLVQDTLSRRRLIERFTDEAEASLFAVTSYWQGVDVPGHSLSLVTIDRLPFSRPDDPLSQARRERAGDNAFQTVDLPRAAMLLAQGVGRLIRSSTDRGVVAVLDTRLATANYRGRLLSRLPPMKRSRNKDEVLEFLRAINRESHVG